MTIGVTAASSYDIGRVLRRGFGVIGLRWLVLGVLILVLGWTPQIIDTVFQPVRHQPGAHDLPGFWVQGSITIGFLVLQSTLALAIISVSLRAPQDPASPIDAVAQALRALVTLAPYLIVGNAPTLTRLWLQWNTHNLFGLSLLLSAVALGGLIFNIVLNAVWGVLAPVVLAERRGLIASMGRAASLLNGARWKFIAIWLLTRIAAASPSFLVRIVLVLAFGAFAFAHTTINYRLTILAANLLGSLFNTFWVVLTAVSYQELRRIRDGVEAGDIEAVFA